MSHDDAGNGTRQQLGILIGELRGINRRLDQADESRTRMHERLNEQTAQVSDLKHDVSLLSGKVAATEGKVTEVLSVVGRVEDLERSRKQVKSVLGWAATHLTAGAKWTLAAIVAALVAFWRELLDFFRG